MADAGLTKFLEDVVDKLRLGDARLGLPPGTLQMMALDDDYLMVIKMIATVEPTINELIALQMSRPIGLGGNPAARFSGVTDFAIRQLPLSGRASKLEFAEALGVLMKWDRDFVEALSQIRNRYAHNIRNVSRPLSEMVTEALKNDANFGLKLFRLKDDFSTMENAVLKLALLYSFAIFIEDAERYHALSHDGLAGLFGGLLANIPPTGDTADGNK